MVQKLAEIDDEPLVLATQREEIVRVVGSDLDAIAATLLERVNDLAGFLESQDVETQRKALFAFCRRIVADAQRREIVIETDLLGMAQNETPPGLPAGSCISNLPERSPFHKHSICAHAPAGRRAVPTRRQTARLRSLGFPSGLSLPHRSEGGRGPLAAGT